MEILSRRSKIIFEDSSEEFKNGRVIKTILHNNDVNFNVSLPELNALNILYNKPSLSSQTRYIVELYSADFKYKNLENGQDSISFELERALGDLEHIKIEKEDLKSIFYQLIKGLHFIHSKGFFNFDLKPGNILVFKNNVVKFTDFDIIEIQSNQNKPYNEVSYEYESPEHYDLKYVSPKSDIYSLQRLKPPP